MLGVEPMGMDEDDRVRSMQSVSLMVIVCLMTTGDDEDEELADGGAGTAVADEGRDNGGAVADEGRATGCVAAAAGKCMADEVCGEAAAAA